MSIGIYKITNLINGKCYIGQSWNIEGRWNAHKKQTTSKHLNSAINKYGLENFKFEVIREFSKSELTQIFLNIFEIKYINDYKSYDPQFGYNKTFGGEGGLKTEETKQKIGIKSKGRYFSPEARQRMSLAKKGKTHKVDKETGYKISIAKAGHSTSQETKDKISKTLTGKKIGPRDPSAGQNISKGLIGKRKGCIWINNGLEQKTIAKDKLLNFIEIGYSLGRLKKYSKKYYVYNDTEVVKVYKHEIEDYLNKGYKVGNGKAKKWIKINNGTNVLKIEEKNLEKFIAEGWLLGTLSRKDYMNTNEYKSKISNANKGRKYVHKGSIIKFVKPSEYEKYLNDGWTDGKKDKVIKAIEKKARKKKSAESIERSRQAQIGHRNYSTPEGIEKMKKAKLGSKIMNNGKENRYFRKEEIDLQLSLGWTFGKLI